jgi:D-glycero-beta-D-manno-heptose 1-phosphate adenylyltransferase
MRSRSGVKQKILDLKQLAAESRRLRDAGKRLVATNGCFDLLHVGHVRYLAAARNLGDVLVVGLNGDESVSKLKGAGRPLNNERDRAEVLAALESVDYVTIFSEIRATGLLRAAQPSVYVKGGDYKMETLNSEELAVLQNCGARIEIVPFEKGYSTTGLLAKLRDG